MRMCIRLCRCVCIVYGVRARICDYACTCVSIMYLSVDLFMRAHWQ